MERGAAVKLHGASVTDLPHLIWLGGPVQALALSLVLRETSSREATSLAEGDSVSKQVRPTSRSDSTAGRAVAERGATREGDGGTCGLDSTEASPLRGWTSPGAGHGALGSGDESARLEDRGERGGEATEEESPATGGGRGGTVVIEKILRLLEEQTSQEDSAETKERPSPGGEGFDAHVLYASLREGEDGVRKPAPSGDTSAGSARLGGALAGNDGVRGVTSSFAQAVKGLNVISDLLGYQKWKLALRLCVALFERTLTHGGDQSREARQGPAAGAGRRGQRVAGSPLRERYPQRELPRCLPS